MLSVLVSSVRFGQPKPDLLVPPQRKPYLGIYCRFGYGFAISSVYNAIILAACSYYAFRARRVPDHFNESKFIGVSVYSMILVCLAAIPVYATANDVSQKIGALCVPLLLNTYLSLVCLYLPKMFAIRYNLEVNTQSRSFSMHSENARRTMDTVSPKSDEACGP